MGMNSILQPHPRYRNTSNDAVHEIMTQSRRYKNDGTRHKFKIKALFYRTIEIVPSNYQGEKNTSTRKWQVSCDIFLF